MKLLYFQIGRNARFRSLYPGFEIRFRESDQITENSLMEFNPFCLAGLNGRGKSNVMEALATIFFHLECCVARFLPSSYPFRRESCSVDAFEVIYLIQRNDGTSTVRNYDRIRVVKQTGEAPRMYRSPYDEPAAERAVSLSPIEDGRTGIIIGPAEGKLFLPEIIVGYSSGENEILSIPFRKSRLINFDKYREDLVEGRAFEMPENSLIYIDAGMSQAVLLACLLFEEQETTLAPFKRILGIRDLLSFRMQINLHRIETRSGESLPLTDHIGDHIEFLKQCAVSRYETFDDDGRANTLKLQFHVDATTRRLFRQRFGSGFALFRLLQVLYELNNHFVPENIKRKFYSSRGVSTHGKLPEASTEQQAFHFLDFLILKETDYHRHPYPLLLSEFSDGEHQFIHTMGICMMLKGQRSLLLLDEPETHFNPEWRSKFIRMLERTLQASERDNLLQEILITSHSPFIVSDCRPGNVLVFRPDEKGRPVAIKASALNIPTYGTSVNLLTAQLFEERQTIGDYAMSRIESYRHQLKAGRPLGELIDEINREMGDSVEKLMLINEFSKQ